MNRNLPTLTLAVLVSCLTIIVPSQVIADSLDEPLEMDRGSNPDNQANATYQAAVEAADHRLQQRLSRCVHCLITTITISFNSGAVLYVYSFKA